MEDRRKKVMIVDDSKAMIMLLRRILEQGGYHVVGEVQTGEEAIEQYQKLRPDLVTMDLILPGIGGAETTKRIIQKDSRAIIVAVSSVGGAPQKLMEVLKAGAKNVISKPFDPEKVVMVLEEVLKV